MPAHPLDDISVFDPDGQPARLGVLRSGRTTAFVFVRHFGRLFCLAQIAAARSVHDRLLTAGGPIILHAWRHGFRQSRTAGAPLHQGDLVVIDLDGRERYGCTGRRAGDHPRWSALTRACEVSG